MEIYSIRLGLNSCYLIRGKSTIMIDGGMPFMFRTFKRKLAKLRMKPDETNPDSSGRVPWAMTTE